STYNLLPPRFDCSVAAGSGALAVHLLFCIRRAVTFAVTISETIMITSDRSCDRTVNRTRNRTHLLTHLLTFRLFSTKFAKAPRARCKRLQFRKLRQDHRCPECPASQKKSQFGCKQSPQREQGKELPLPARRAQKRLLLFELLKFLLQLRNTALQILDFPQVVLSGLHVRHGDPLLTLYGEVAGSRVAGCDLQRCFLVAAENEDGRL